MAIVLVFGDNLAPAGIAPAGEDPTCFRPQCSGRFPLEAVFDEGVLRDLLIALQDDLRMTKEAPR